MAENHPRGARPKKHGSPLVQRPLRQYNAAKDEALARKLQQEEEDKLFAAQFQEQLNEKIVPSIDDETFTNTDISNDSFLAAQLHQEFVRYRGMTTVDSLLAEQLQKQEEERVRSQQQELQRLQRHFQQHRNNFHQIPFGVADPQHHDEVNPESPSNATSSSDRPIINIHVLPRAHARNIQMRGGGAGAGGRGEGHSFQVGMPRQFMRGGAAAGRPPFYFNRGVQREHLPEGELDPEALLLTFGDNEGNNFVSVMQDPMLLMALLISRAPGTVVGDGIDLNDYEGLWELAERLGDVRRNGMTEEEISNLPSHQHQSGAASPGSSDCQICLSSFETGEEVKTLPCTHEYHSHCVGEWLKRNGTCPICRQQIKPS